MPTPKTSSKKPNQQPTINHRPFRSAVLSPDLLTRPLDVGSLASQHAPSDSRLDIVAFDYIPMVIRKVAAKLSKELGESALPSRGVLIAGFVRFGLSRILSSVQLRDLAIIRREVDESEDLSPRSNLEIHQYLSGWKFAFPVEGTRRISFRCPESLRDEIAEAAEEVGLSIRVLGGLALIAGLLGQPGIHQKFETEMDRYYSLLKDEVAERVARARRKITLYREMGDSEEGDLADDGLLDGPLDSFVEDFGADVHPDLEPYGPSDGPAPFGWD